MKLIELAERKVMRWRAGVAYWMVAKAVGVYPPLLRELVSMTKEGLFAAMHAEAEKRARAAMEGE